MTGVSRLKKAEQRLNYAKTTFSAGKVMISVFWKYQGILFIYFLIEKRTINAAYYSKSLLFKTTRSARQKRLSPPHQRASSHRRCDNRNTGGGGGRYCHTLLIVLTWCQAIFTCFVRSKWAWKE
jgi:hypothetical protein